MTPEDVQSIVICAKDRLGLQLVDLPARIFKWQNEEELQTLCKKLAASIKKNQHRAYLLSGEFGITVGQWLIRKNFIIFSMQ